RRGAVYPAAGAPHQVVLNAPNTNRYGSNIESMLLPYLFVFYLSCALGIGVLLALAEHDVIPARNRGTLGLAAWSGVIALFSSLVLSTVGIFLVLIGDNHQLRGARGDALRKLRQ